MSAQAKQTSGFIVHKARSLLAGGLLNNHTTTGFATNTSAHTGVNLAWGTSAMQILSEGMGSLERS